MNTPKRLAILGGTFDPIHNGHIIPAKNVAKWLGIDRISILPAHLPPHKNTVSASAQQRVDMVKLVCENEALFDCDERELKRTSLSYTVDTLKEIKNEHGSNSRIFFIIGMDSLLNFTQWHQWQEILTLCHLVVNCRPDYPLNNLSTATHDLLSKHRLNKEIQVKDIQTNAGYILFPPEIHLAISSTVIKAKIKAQQNCQELLTKNVLNYIEKQQLYR